MSSRQQHALLRDRFAQEPSRWQPVEAPEVHCTVAFTCVRCHAPVESAALFCPDCRNRPSEAERC